MVPSIYGGCVAQDLGDRDPLRRIESSRLAILAVDLGQSVDQGGVVQYVSVREGLQVDLPEVLVADVQHGQVNQLLRLGVAQRYAGMCGRAAA